MQHLRAARLAKRLKTETIVEEEYLPKELIARVDVCEEQEQQLAGNASDSDLNSDSGDSEDEDCEITDSEEQKPVHATTPALQIFIASSQPPPPQFESTVYHCRRVLPEALDSVSSTSINRFFHHCNLVSPTIYLQP